MIKRISWKLVAVAMSGLLMSACATQEQKADPSAAKDTATLTAAQKQMAGIQTGSLQYKFLSAAVPCTGEIEVPPQGMASVTAPLGGYLLQTRMVPGAKVHRGAVLATLTNPEYIALQQSYLETMSQLTFAELDYNRQKLLREQDATAVKKLQESESGYNVLKARLAGLREQLKLIGVDLKQLHDGSIQSAIQLRSPINGFVTEVNHHPGQFVEAREVLFELVDMRDLHFQLNVFEQDIASIQKGQSIRFRPAGSRQYTHRGIVSLVSPKKTMGEETFDVHGHIKGEHDNLKPGMYIEAEILVSGDSVHALPEHALIYDHNKPLVLVEANGSYHEQAVHTGATMDGWVEILNYEALQGKKIVIDGATRLFTAMRLAN